MNPHYAQVALRAQHRCEYCGAPETMFNFPFEVEHVIPLAHGGQENPANWALSCRSCNLYKAAHLTDADPETGQEVPLYHPRHDAWGKHFEIDVETGALLGKTSIGRATIICLHMNSDTQLLARRLWIRLGIFP